MSQPIWKLLSATDTKALYIDETGVYDPELALLEEYETKRRTMRFYVYRFPLERYKVVRESDEDTTTRYLVPSSYEPTWSHHVSQYAPWFYDDLADVASSAGTSRMALIHGLCSSDPRARARVYVDIAGHFGADEFDPYPQDWTESEAKDWPDRGKVEIRISTNDDDDGMVTLYCDDVEAARDAQSVLGSRWLISDGSLAYASVCKQPDLVAALEADGYDVDSSEWCPPDDQDFRFWHAKNERTNGACPAKLRDILGWHAISDVRVTRRVADQIERSWWNDEERDAFARLCFELGFVIDAEQWLDEQENRDLPSIAGGAHALP